jgi:serine/threonine-protein kinase
MTGESESRAGSYRVREGQIISNRYRIDGALGEGGMGVVVTATHLDLKKRFAIKLLPSGADGGSRAARFEREARAACQLESEHVARVFDFGRLEDDSPYLVMEHLDGKDLRRTLRERGRFSLREAADDIIEASDALAEAHAQGIVHRDVKPSNLFLARRPDGSTHVKVLDFGVSKVPSAGAADAGLTGITARLGTAAYMSPEQARSARLVDHRTDIWSLGVVLYELLSGEKPFGGATDGEILAHIEQGSPRPLRELAPEVPPAVAELVDRCLARDRDERVADVGELARALAPYASDAAQPIVERIERLLALRTGAPSESPALPEGGSPGDVEAQTPSATAPGWSSSSAGSTPESRAAPSSLGRWEGRILPGGLRLLRLIGHGAMGEVYEAADEAGERVAVKIILAGAVVDLRSRERLLIEAKSASLLSSEHVVRIVNPGLHDVDGHPYIVMELLHGQPLDHLIAERKALDPAAVVRIFLQVCEGLAEAHAHGLVHRDIKPANLFLHEVSDGEVLVKICDFGIAKIAESEAPGRGSNGLTQTWQCLGSPAYMSPEQMSDPREVDARSDVWSVCVSMYEALSGVRPWPGAMSPIDIGVAIATRGVPPLLDVAPWLDPALEKVVHHGLALDKASRHPSVTALAAALRPFAGDEARLTSSMLRAVTNEEQLVAKRPAAPTPAIEARPRPAPMRLLAVAVTAGAALALGLAAILGSRSQPAGPSAGAAHEDARATEPWSADAEATATIPATATVVPQASAGPPGPPVASSASAGSAKVKPKRGPTSPAPATSTRPPGKIDDPLGEL